MTAARHWAQLSTGRPNTVHDASSTIKEVNGLTHEDLSNVVTSSSLNTARPRHRARLGRLAKRAGMRVVYASQSSLAKINPLPSLKTRLFEMLSSRETLDTSTNDDTKYVFVNSSRPMPPLPLPQRQRGIEDEAGGPRASSSSSFYEYNHSTPNKSNNTSHPSKRNGIKFVDQVPIFSGWAMYCGTYKPPKLVSRTHWDDAVEYQKAQRMRLAQDVAVQEAEAYETRLKHAVEAVIRECEEDKQSCAYEAQYNAAIVPEHGLGLAAHRRPGHLKLDTLTAVKYTNDGDGGSTPALSTPADTIGSSGPPSRAASAHFEAISDGDD